MRPLDLAAWCAALFLATTLFAHTVALRLLLLAAGVALVGAEIARMRIAGRGFDLRILPPLVLPFALWAAWALASTSWSMEPERTLKEFRNEIVYVFVAFWLCYVAAQARGARRVIPFVTGIGVAAACVLGVLDLWLEGPGGALFKFYAGPGGQTSALLTLLPGTVAAGWLAYESGVPKRMNVALLVLAALLFASAAATLNRTVWLGFVVQFVLLGALYMARPGAGTKASGKNATLLALALVATGVVVLGSMLYAVQRERVELAPSHTVARDPRPELWRTVIGRIEERPLTGYGFGRGMLRHALTADFDNQQLWHAHNLLLEVAVEVGVPGLLILLVLLGATARAGWRLARSPDNVAFACGAALLAVLAGMLVRNMTDVLWIRQNALLYWGVTGALLSWGTRSSGRYSGTQAPKASRTAS